MPSRDGYAWGPSSAGFGESGKLSTGEFTGVDGLYSFYIYIYIFNLFILFIF